MLNTDLHSRNIKSEKKMRLEQFIKNLRGKLIKEEREKSQEIRNLIEHFFFVFVMIAYVYSKCRVFFLMQIRTVRNIMNL